MGSYGILGRIRPVAYRSALPPAMSNVYDVFHVSRLRKYKPDPSQRILEETVEFQGNLTYPEEPIEVLDRKEQVFRSKIILLVKVLWRHHNIEEATWEREEEMRQKYPHLFSNMKS